MHFFGAPYQDSAMRTTAVARLSRLVALAAPIGAVAPLAACAGPTTAPDLRRTPPRQQVGTQLGLPSLSEGTTTSSSTSTASTDTVSSDSTARTVTGPWY
jgi:hypothetical protein